jgi:hypothetical protein
MDPLGVVGTAPAWAASTAYGAGDVVVNGGLVYTCTTGHTSTGSFNASNFRLTSWIYGTGKAGSTTGDGVADVFIQSDGTHPTQLAHQMMERRFHNAIVSHLRTLTA